MQDTNNPDPTKLLYCAVSIRGCRPMNQDALLVDGEVHADDTEPVLVPVAEVTVGRDWRVFAIADGMGGHASGELASRFVLSRLNAIIESGAAMTPESLKNHLAGLHLELREFGESQASPDMGTTISGFLIRRSRLLVFNIGDSRTYAFSQGDLVQLTKDHSLKALSRDNSVPQNLLYSSLGGGASDCTVDVWDRSSYLEMGKSLLVTCDGYHEYLDPHVVIDLLANPLNLQNWYQEVESAQQRGSRDNISIIAVTLSRNSEQPPTQKEPDVRSNH